MDEEKKRDDERAAMIANIRAWQQKAPAWEGDLSAFAETYKNLGKEIYQLQLIKRKLEDGKTLTDIQEDLYLSAEELAALLKESNLEA